MFIASVNNALTHFVSTHSVSHPLNSFNSHRALPWFPHQSNLVTKHENLVLMKQLLWKVMLGVTACWTNALHAAYLTHHSLSSHTPFPHTAAPEASQQAESVRHSSIVSHFPLPSFAFLRKTNNREVPNCIISATVRDNKGRFDVNFFGHNPISHKTPRTMRSSPARTVRKLPTAEHCRAESVKPAE